MEEVFVMDGESHDSVKQQLTEARDRMLQIKKDHHFEMEPNGGAIEVRLRCSVVVQRCPQTVYDSG